jgi:radical SAM protein with 4Fe4S-binding SPASM domain
MDPKQKYQLFRKNKHFCTAPWNLLYVGVNGTVHTCSHGNQMGDLQKHDISEVLINNEFKLLRKDILKDKITNNCKYCLQRENVSVSGNFKGLRNHYNSLSVDSSTE